MKTPLFGNRYYTLDAEHHLVRCDDLLTWARWFEDTPNRIVEQTKISDTCRVSTVFLGMDHGWGKGPPICFETMVFGGPEGFEDSQWRYSSWDDAEVGHEMVVRKVLAVIKARAAQH